MTKVAIIRFIFAPVLSQEKPIRDGLWQTVDSVRTLIKQLNVSIRKQDCRALREPRICQKGMPLKSGSKTIMKNVTG